MSVSDALLGTVGYYEKMKKFIICPVKFTSQDTIEIRGQAVGDTEEE